MSEKMNTAEIETMVGEALNESIQTAIRNCISELNALGHNFRSVDEFLDEWREPETDRLLSIHCSLVVHCRNEPDLTPVHDPVIDEFFALAESGKDSEAELLNLMEGDISNGGFSQLLDNKGVDFMKEALALLEKIGSDSAHGLVKQGLELIESGKKTIDQYEKLQGELFKLDELYYDQEENVPALFLEYRDKGRDSRDK
jgi:hypothetical protein